MKKVKYAELEFFEYLAEHYGGTTGLAEYIQKDFWTVSNWKNRGHVPAKEVRKIAEKLKIDPLVLNNKHFHYISNWKDLIKHVKFLDRLQLKELDKLPLKYK